MKTKEIIAWENWPCVPPALRPKKLYVNESLTFLDRESLVAKGWLPLDIRLLPSETDNERGFAVKAWLEGIRFGSILATDGVAKYIELEAKIYSLLIQKEQQEAKQLDGATLQELLSIGAQWTSKITQVESSSNESKAQEKSLIGKGQLPLPLK